MGDKKLRSDIVNLRVVAILAVIFGHSTTIYWYNWTDYRTTQEAPVFAHVGNLAMLVLGLWMLISGFCVGFTLRGKKRFKDFFIKRFSRLVIPYWLVALIWMIPIRLLIEYPGYEGQSFLYILWKNIFLGYDNGQLWYLPTLFFYSLIAWFINFCLKKFKWADIFAFAISVMMLIIYTKYTWHGASLMRSPTLSPFFLYFSFFMLGFILFNHEATIRKYITKPLLVVGFVLMLIAIGFMYMGRGGTFVQLIAVWLCLVVIFFLMPNKSNKFTRTLAEVSLGVYLFHEPLAFISYTYWPDINPLLMVSINFFIWGTVASIISYFVFVFPKKIMRKKA